MLPLLEVVTGTMPSYTFNLAGRAPLADPFFLTERAFFVVATDYS